MEFHAVDLCLSEGEDTSVELSRAKRPGKTGAAWIVAAAMLVCLTQATLCRGEEPDAPVDAEVTKAPARPDFNEDIFYRNKLEYSEQTGVLPINIPFVFDVFVGGDYSQKPLHYTLVPNFESIRWQMGKINGPWFLRGNTDMTASLSYTAVVRGPESRYEAFDLGWRRNFIQRNWKLVPFFEFRTGVGEIDAQEPHGVKYAQGQDLTFTLLLNDGVRYSFNSKYSIEIGGTYMHVSNLYLSEPKYQDNGINVTGGMMGFNVRLGRPKRRD